MYPQATIRVREGYFYLLLKECSQRQILFCKLLSNTDFQTVSLLMSFLTSRLPLELLSKYKFHEPVLNAVLLKTSH